VIEQVLMRSLKSHGGLGLMESVHLMWIYTMHSCADIHGAMTEVTQLKHTSTNNKEEKRCITDLSKIQAWFEDNDPFSRADGRLCCLSTFRRGRRWNQL